MGAVNKHCIKKDGDLSAEPEVKLLKSVLKALGIHDIDNYIEKITQVMKNPCPPGFKFQCRNHTDLARRLSGVRVTQIAQAKEQLKLVPDPNIKDKKVAALFPKAPGTGNKKMSLAMRDPLETQMMKPQTGPNPAEGTVVSQPGAEQADRMHHDDRGTPEGLFNAANSKGESFREKGLTRSLHVVVGPIVDCHLDSHGILEEDGHNNFDAMSDHLTFDLGPELPILSYLYWGLTENVNIGPFMRAKHREGFDFELLGGMQIYGTF